MASRPGRVDDVFSDRMRGVFAAGAVAAFAADIPFGDLVPADAVVDGVASFAERTGGTLAVVVGIDGGPPIGLRADVVRKPLTLRKVPLHSEGNVIVTLFNEVALLPQHDRISTGSEAAWASAAQSRRRVEIRDHLFGILSLLTLSGWSEFCDLAPQECARATQALAGLGARATRLRSAGEVADLVEVADVDGDRDVGGVAVVEEVFEADLHGDGADEFAETGHLEIFHLPDFKHQGAEIFADERHFAVVEINGVEV